jgi:hypothetical protein
MWIAKTEAMIWSEGFRIDICLSQERTILWAT